MVCSGMVKIVIAVTAVALTAVAAQAMRTDGMRLSTNIIDLREHAWRAPEASPFGYAAEPNRIVWAGRH